MPLAVFAAMVAADRTFGAPGRGYDYVVKVDLPGEDERAGLPQIQGPLDSSRPLVVIDAGHGGKDPGAGRGTLREKDLTLSLALALRDDLLRKGGVRVALTRALTAQGVSALWATHILDEIRPTDGLVILHKGRVLADGNAGEIGQGDLTRRFLDLTGGDA